MKSFSSFLSEALLPHHAAAISKWIEKSGGEEVVGKKLSAHVFKGKDVLIHNLHDEPIDIPIHPMVKEHLEKHGYSLRSSAEYHAGYAIDRHNRITSIGKALSKTKADPSVVSAFTNDPNRAVSSKKNLAIAYTWEPHHVASMSTGRGWTSCMDMSSGSNAHYLEHDIANGTHCAYLIHKDDEKIENPIARIALKPYTSVDGHTILRPEGKQYGTPTSAFEQQVSNFADTHFPPAPNKTYRLNRDLYKDSSEFFTHHDDATIDKVVHDAMNSSMNAVGLLKHDIVQNPQDAHTAVQKIISADPENVSSPENIHNDQNYLFHTVLSGDTYGTLHSKTIDAIVEHSAKTGHINDHLSNRIVEGYHGKLSPKTANILFSSLKEHEEKRSNRFEPHYHLLSNTGVTDEQLHSGIKQSPTHFLNNFSENRVKPEFVDSMMHHVRENPDYSLDDSHMSGIITSKHFGKEHIKEYLDALDSRGMTYQSKAAGAKMVKNPNYTISVAREAKQTALAAFHPDATMDDLDRYMKSYEKKSPTSSDIRSIKSPNVIDSLYKNNPTSISEALYADQVPKKCKKYHEILASTGNFIPRTFEDQKGILNVNPYETGESKIAHGTKITVQNTVQLYHSDHRLRPSINTALEHGVNNGDNTYVAGLMQHVRSGNVPIKKSLMNRIVDLYDAHGYRTDHLSSHPTTND
jgi:hypothetical protein